MKKRERKSTESQMVLRWMFRQKDRLLTCGVSRAAGAAFEVVTVPHWDVRGASVERFSCAMAALGATPRSRQPARQGGRRPHMR
jgi:hypothetical protein